MNRASTKVWQLSLIGVVRGINLKRLAIFANVTKKSPIHKIQLSMKIGGSLELFRLSMKALRSWTAGVPSNVILKAI